jgi:hypothetical protein
MNVSAPFIRRPIATSLIMAAIAFCGIAAYPLLPVAPLPEVDFPTISVTARLPGASPASTAISTPPRRTCRPPSPRPGGSSPPICSRRRPTGR